MTTSPMKSMNSKFILAVLLAGVILLSLASYTLAQITGDYDLSWHAVAAGGGTSSAGGYTLSATSGQAAASLLTGGGYTLASGFWSLPMPIYVYLPFIAR